MKTQIRGVTVSVSWYAPREYRHIFWQWLPVHMGPHAGQGYGGWCFIWLGSVFALTWSKDDEEATA